MIFRPISVQLSSTYEADDLLRSIKIILTPWLWQSGQAIHTVETWFSRHFNTKWVFPFNSGRSALYSILKAAKIGSGDEVLVQAFTCIAVPNAVLWTGAIPRYVETIANEFTMSVEDLRHKISKKTKCIIVQHTFGFSDKVDEIRTIAEKHGILFIEDCAHSLGNIYDNSLVGTFSDAAIFSFGRDKVVSSVFGGFAIVRRKDLAEELTKEYAHLKNPNNKWIFQQLLYPLAFMLILPIYKIQLGKALLFLLQKIRVLSKPISENELFCKRPSRYPEKLPNALAILVLGQLAKLKHFQNRRKSAAKLYRKHLKNLPIILPTNTNNSLLRFPILTADAKLLVQSAKKQGIILGRWYSNVIDPKETDFRKVNYTKKSCTNAESVAKRIVNLPTAPVLCKQEIMAVIAFIKSHYNTKINKQKS